MSTTTYCYLLLGNFIKAITFFIAIPLYSKYDKLLFPHIKAPLCFWMLGEILLYFKQALSNVTFYWERNGDLCSFLMKNIKWLLNISESKCTYFFSIIDFFCEIRLQKRHWTINQTYFKTRSYPSYTQSRIVALSTWHGISGKKRKRSEQMYDIKLIWTNVWYQISNWYEIISVISNSLI